MMRVGLNLLYLRPGLVGGTETYSRELIKALGIISDIELVAFCTKENHECIGTPGTVKKVIVRSPIGHRLGRLWGEQVGLPIALRQEPVDVLHSPANWACILAPSSLPQVATIHDLQHYWFPENFSVATRMVRSLLDRLTVARAQHLIAISDFTRQDVIARCGVKPPQITTVLEGVDRMRVPDDEAVRRAREAFGLRGPYYIYPAMMAPHKNHSMLFRAFASVIIQTLQPVQLVLTGRLADVERREMVKVLRPLGLGGRVCHVGYVSRDDVLALIRGAVALLFPSRFEGFGLPILEAMQCGTPVLAARGSAISEVAGAAGVLLDPDEPEDWAKAALRVLADEGHRRQVVTAGNRNVERFSWERCAAETVEIYRRCWREWRRASVRTR